MPLAMDSKLPSQSRSPLRSGPASAPAMSRNTRMAPRINDRSVADQANNLYGRTGAREMKLQSMDRAGISRGKGQKYRAEMAGAMQDSQNRADAMQAEMGASQANAAAAQQYDAMRNSERMNNQGLLQNLRDNQRQARSARQSAGMDAYETMLRGQYALDSMQLDRTPLLGALFS
jgi:hypothetical protein